jgi:hypothetical protein
MMHPVSYQVIAWSKRHRGELMLIAAICFSPHLAQLAELPQK